MEKKNYAWLLLIALLFSLSESKAQVEVKYYPKKNALKAMSKIADSPIVFAKTVTLPAFDVERLRTEDQENDGLDIPFRFGRAFDVSYSLADGTWTDVSGGKLWSLTNRSVGAKSLNFIFSDFRLPEGATLHIVNQDGTMLYGPVTSETLQGSGSAFLTDLIAGDIATIYLFEPKSQEGLSTLTIKRIVHGYRGFENMSYGLIGSSSPCNIDVACYPEYEKESDGVGLVLLPSGNELCSGALVMSTDASYKPYFLTAFHCIDNDKIGHEDGVISDAERDSVGNWLFKFHYKRQNCDGDGLVTSYTYNGAYLRAAWRYTDFALLELKDDVKSNSSLSWLGWSRSTGTHPHGVGIHHPDGDIMKISIENDSIFGTSNVIYAGRFWEVNYDLGVVQPGSSGSPLLNQDKRVIGQLLGGSNSDDPCDNKLARYGAFAVSWHGGGTSETRLSDWLDPYHYNLMEMDGGYPNQYKIVGSPVVVKSNTNTYYIEDLPSGLTVQWELISGYINAFVKIQNGVPSLNMCSAYVWTSEVDNAKGLLAAKIYDGDKLVTIAVRQISVSNKLTATVSQESCYCAGNLRPAITSKTIDLSSGTAGLVVNQCCTATLECPAFEVMTINHSGIQPDYFAFNGTDKIYFSLPAGSSGAPMHITGNGGGFSFALAVFASAGNVTYNTQYLQILHSGSNVNVSIKTYAETASYQQA